MAARRSPWLNDRTNLLLAELGEREMTLPEEVARQVIADRLDEVAARMGVSRRAARNYVTEDVIADLAAEILGINDGGDSTQANVVSIVAERLRRRRR
jgi:hypothetical protein